MKESWYLYINDNDNERWWGGGSYWHDDDDDDDYDDLYIIGAVCLSVCLSAKVIISVFKGFGCFSCL